MKHLGALLTQNASAPVGEVATLSTSTNLPTSHTRWTPFLLSLIRTAVTLTRSGIVATSRRVGVLSRVAKECRDAAVRELNEWFDSDAETIAPCPDCGRPCANVLPDLPTAEACRGPLRIAQCTVCPETVVLTRDGECPSSPYHATVRIREMRANDYHARKSV